MSQNTKFLLLGLCILLVIVVLFFVSFDLRLGQYEDSESPVQEAEPRTTEVKQTEQEFVEQEAVIPNGDYNTRIVSGDSYNFSFDLPTSFRATRPKVYLTVEDNELLHLEYVTPSYSYVKLNIISGDLRGQCWSPAGDWIPFCYDRNTDTWPAQSPNLAADFPGPQKVRLGVHNAFLAKSADGGGNGETVWLLGPDKSYFLKLFFMRNNESTETSIETTKTVVQSFKFISQ